MNRFKVRVHELGITGFLTQADHFADHEFEAKESLEEFARRISQYGFRDTHDDKRWIMPGAIIWVEQR